MIAIAIEILDKSDPCSRYELKLLIRRYSRKMKRASNDDEYKIFGTDNDVDLSTGWISKFQKPQNSSTFISG